MQGDISVSYGVWTIISSHTSNYYLSLKVSGSNISARRTMYGMRLNGTTLVVNCTNNTVLLFRLKMHICKLFLKNLHVSLTEPYWRKPARLPMCWSDMGWQREWMLSYVCQHVCWQLCPCWLVHELELYTGETVVAW